MRKLLIVLMLLPFFGCDKEDAKPDQKATQTPNVLLSGQWFTYWQEVREYDVNLNLTGPPTTEAPFPNHVITFNNGNFTEKSTSKGDVSGTYTMVADSLKLTAPHRVVLPAGTYFVDSISSTDLMIKTTIRVNATTTQRWTFKARR